MGEGGAQFKTTLCLRRRLPGDFLFFARVCERHPLRG